MSAPLVAESHLAAAAAQFPQCHFQRSTITAPSLAAPAYLTHLAAYPLPSAARECLAASRTLPQTLQRSACRHTLLAAVSSERIIKLYDYGGAQGGALAHFGDLRGHKRAIHDLQFHGVHGSYDTAQVNTANGTVMLVSASQDATVRVWDTRQQNAAAVFTHPENKPFISCAASGNLVVAGSGSVVHVWDLRASALLAANEDFHTEDVNQIAFHPLEPHQFFTASEDGLISVLDPRDADQDEWLINVLNTENPVSRIGFFGPQAEYVWALSCVETLSLWHTEDCRRESDFTNIRHALTVAAHMPIDYLVDAHYEQQGGRVFLASGTNDGQLVLAHVNKDEIQPFCLAHVANKPVKRAADGAAASAAAAASSGGVSKVTGFNLQPLLPNDSPFALASMQQLGPVPTAAAAMDDGDDAQDEAGAPTEADFLKDGEVVMNGANGEGDERMADTANGEGSEEADLPVSAAINANDEGHTAPIRDMVWLDKGVLITAGEDSRLCVWAPQAPQSSADNGPSSSGKIKQHASSSAAAASSASSPGDASSKEKRQFKPY